MLAGLGLPVLDAGVAREADLQALEEGEARALVRHLEQARVEVDLRRQR